MSDSSIIVGGAPPPNPNSWNPTAAADMPAGTPVYVSSDGHVGKARANTAGPGTTSLVVGLTLTAAVSGGKVATRFAGLITLSEAQWAQVLNTGSTLVPGTKYYVSAATAGKITLTKPTTGSNTVAPVGVATSSLGLMIQLQLPVIGV